MSNPWEDATLLTEVCVVCGLFQVFLLLLVWFNGLMEFWKIPSAHADQVFCKLEVKKNCTVMPIPLKEN